MSSGANEIDKKVKINTNVKVTMHDDGAFSIMTVTLTNITSVSCESKLLL